MKFQLIFAFIVSLVGTLEAFRMTPSFLRSRSLMQVSLSDEVQHTSASSEAGAPPATFRPSLFIGNIPFEVSEAELEAQVRAKLGENFAKVNLIKDKATGRSRGFAYANVQQEDDMERALEQLTGLEINGRPLKVDFKTSSELRPRTGAPERADRRSNDRRERPPRAERSSSDFAEITERSLYIGNLDYSMSRERLEAFLGANIDMSQIRNVRVSFNPETQQCKGFAHVEFDSSANALAAIDQLAGKDIEGRPLKVNSAGRKPEDGDRPRKTFQERGAASSSTAISGDAVVFVGNLAWDVTDELMEEMLSDVVGKDSFVKVRVAKDRETGKPRGFAHVEFVDSATANKAIGELNGLEVLGRPLRADLSNGGVGGGRGGDRPRGGGGGNGGVRRESREGFY